MRTLTICDDDAVFSDMITEILRRGPYADSLCVSCVLSPRELEDRVRVFGAPDILLMDVVIAEADGVAAVKRLQESCPRTQVIYITGFIENCTRVYETKHVWFLTKPICASELNKALAAALECLAALDGETVTVKTGSDTRLVPKADILFVESVGRKLAFHTKSGDLDTYGRLDDMERELGDGFIRCHKSFCVNLRHITALVDGAFETGEIRVPISQKRYKTAREAFLSYLESLL